MADSSLRIAALKRRVGAVPEELKSDITSQASKSPGESNLDRDTDDDEEENDMIGDLPSASALHAPSRKNLIPPAMAPAAYTPIASDDCFATALEVEIAIEHAETPAVVRAYFTPPTTKSEPDNFSECTVFVCHHGAGSGALSFALFAQEVTRQTQGEVGILAYDCRGHGRSKFPEMAAKVLSLTALTDDMIAILTTIFPDSAKRPRIVLIGHSMGGAVVVSGASALQQQSAAEVSGVAMLDIVEGTSLEMLPRMLSVIQRRPQGFVSVQAAIQWHLETRTIRNLESARRSVRSLLHYDATYEPLGWRWVTDLAATEQFWRGWFLGLSSRFLSTKSARLLILAETDNLDQELMIGQMQGKYQLTIARDAGHNVQEVSDGLM
ncbi:protein phosphatase methylesterase-1 [Malassezia psittaci]|uniref:Protein phosphatase methylesterase 1 n=1 Tax=Malassezia psittaci TaxID=1821823 RepID=A0AAF0JG17_9BASI|nr:protein phosphatase methylesterase-1 [Malassezia psittaci]